MTCGSTQPALDATTQYGTPTLEFIQSFAETIARNDPRWSLNRVAEGQITLARALCNIVACL